MRKLLLVVDSLDIGGAERHVVDLAIALRSQGYGIAVACSTTGPLQADLDGAGIPVHLLGGDRGDGPVKRCASPRYASRLHTLVRAAGGNGFDLVHVHGYASMVAAVPATRAEGIPLMVTAHSEATWQGPQARGIARQAYTFATRIVAVSEGIGRRLIHDDGVPATRVSVIPNAVPREPSAAPRRTAAPYRRAAPRSSVPPPRPGDGPLIGVIARLEPEKGVGLFLEAASRLTASHPEARYVVIGDGSEREKLVAQSRWLGLEGRVHFLGLRGDARALMSTLDVLAVPSFTEGSPLIVLEAMAAAMSIAATAAGGIPEQIRHEQEGLLVPPGDAAALSAAIATFLRNPVLARRLGAAARERSLSLFSYESMLARTEACYRATLIDSGRSGGYPQGAVVAKIAGTEPDAPGSWKQYGGYPHATKITEHHPKVG